MKSPYKIFLALSFCAAALTAGASPSPMERATMELQPGGELYVVLRASSIQRHVTETYLALERGVAESSRQDRDSMQSTLTLLRAAYRLFGIPEIAVLGASSIRDAELGFSNRAVIVAESDSTGWMWRLHGNAEPRLARIGKFPADAMFAADFCVDMRPAVADLEKSECKGLLRQRCQWLPMISVSELLESLSGNWQIVAAINEGQEWECDKSPLTELEKCDIYISAPDNRGALKKALELFRAMSPAAKQTGNATYIPRGDGSTLVFVTLERRVMIFSSVRSFDKFRDGAGLGAPPGSGAVGTPPARKQPATLADDPVFAAALKRLPANSNGAYFTSDAKISRVLKIGGNNGLQIGLQNTVSRSIGIWQVGNCAIVNQEFSTEELTTQAFDTLIGSPLMMLADRMLQRKTAPLGPAPVKKVRRDGKKVHPLGAKIKKTVADGREAACRDRLKKVRTYIDGYRKKHNGELPPALPKDLKCGGAAYVYFAPFAVPPTGKMPLVVDPVKHNAHRGAVNVLFVDGSVESFKLEADSLKRLCSYLYTIYRYDEKEFVRLIERASQLDSKKGE